jgi:hypothetical protein
VSVIQSPLSPISPLHASGAFPFLLTLFAQDLNSKNQDMENSAPKSSGLTSGSN